MHTGDELDLAGRFRLRRKHPRPNGEIFLPTARNVRLTLRAGLRGKSGRRPLITGCSTTAIPRRDTRFGHVVEAAASTVPRRMSAIFSSRHRAGAAAPGNLPPVRYPAGRGRGENHHASFSMWRSRKASRHRAAARGDGWSFENAGLTARPEKGGARRSSAAPSRIRHTLAPDRFFAHLFPRKRTWPNHWLCCVQLTIDRDWTWDGLDGG